jgi:hypothetical protein
MQFGAYQRQDGIQVIADLLVREAQDAQAESLVDFSPPRVVAR